MLGKIPSTQWFTEGLYRDVKGLAKEKRIKVVTGQKECSCEHHPAVSFVHGRSYASSGCASGVWINLCWNQCRGGREESSWESSAFRCWWWWCRFVPCGRSACRACAVGSCTDRECCVEESRCGLPWKSSGTFGGWTRQQQVHFARVLP